MNNIKKEINTIQVVFEIELYKEIKAKAKEQNISINKLIKNAVIMYLKAN